MPDQFPAHFIRPAPVPQPKLPVPPLTDTSWQAGAIAMLPYLTPTGRQNALAQWKKLKPPFTPPLP